MTGMDFMPNEPTREVPLNEPIVGEVYLHSSGTSYRVDAIIFSAEGYETTGELPKVVLYTQLDDGELCLAGTRYTRSVQDFMNNFKKVATELSSSESADTEI
jgi:hypothetical protein